VIEANTHVSVRELLLEGTPSKPGSTPEEKAAVKKPVKKTVEKPVEKATGVRILDIIFARRLTSLGT
jgi:hypothetical protein